MLPPILSTDAIDSSGFFDGRYTCDFDNSSPELRWDQIPEGVNSFALMVEDPDARSGSFTHWLIYNIPATLRHLPAGIPPQDTLPNGIRQGLNSFSKLGYAGPCPPLGDRPHRYVIRLYLLSQPPELASRAGRDEFLASIAPHIIGTTEIVGRYQRLAQRAG
jgi:Raf kinase inhibitor-like YbhB/YbcL family protein